MRLLGTFLVFILVYGALQFLFTERKRKNRDGEVQTTGQAVIRTVVISTVAGSIFVVLREVFEFF